MRELQSRVQETVDTLRAISKERPEMVEPLMLAAYELTNGNVRTMDLLNNYIETINWCSKESIL